MPFTITKHNDNFHSPIQMASNIEGDRALQVHLNSSFCLHLYLLDEGEEFYVHHEYWDMETTREPRIIPTGHMFYEGIIKKEKYKYGSTECSDDPYYLRGGNLI